MSFLPENEFEIYFCVSIICELLLFFFRYATQLKMKVCPSYREQTIINLKINPTDPNFKANHLIENRNE